MFRTPTDLSSKLRFACGTPEFLNVVEPIVVIFIKISSDILPRKLYFRIPLVLGGLPFYAWRNDGLLDEMNRELLKTGALPRADTPIRQPGSSIVRV